MIISKAKRAFTLAEIVVACTIVGILLVITVVPFVNSLKQSEAENAIGSQNFYNTVNIAYSKTALSRSNPFDITNSDALTLLNRLLEYLDFSSANYDCNNVNFDSFTATNCAKLNTGIKMGIFIQNDCKLKIDVYDYLKNEDKGKIQNEIATRAVDNACGYIIYQTKHSNGIFKKDAFIIPLGKRRLL